MMDHPNQLKRTTGGDGLRCSIELYTTGRARPVHRDSRVTPATHPKLSCISKGDRTALLLTAWRLNALTLAGVLFFPTFAEPSRVSSRERKGESIIPNPGQYTSKIHKGQG